MSDVILFYPKTGYMERGGLSVHLPLSVLYPGTALVHDGYSVRILDQRVEPRWRQELVRELRSKPVCLGISAMTGQQIRRGLAAVQLAKKHAPEVPTVWGGVHPSLLPHQTAKSELADYVVAGEAEEVLPGLVRYLSNDSDVALPTGVWTNQTLGSPSREPPDLDVLSFPAYDLIDVSRYSQRRVLGESSFPVLTSRGCPHSCAFCYNAAYHGRRWRAESPEKTVEHIQLILGTFGRSVVDIQDDNFFVSPARVETICRLFLKMDLNASFKATCRVDHVLSWDDAFLDLLVRSGVSTLFIGAESGSDRVLSFLDKGHTVDDVLRANSRLARAGLAPRYSFMAGFPGETITEVRQTVQVMLRLLQENPRASCTFLQKYVPYPGTKLGAICETVGWKPPTSLNGWSNHSWYGFDAPWLTREMSALLDRLAVTTMFIGPGTGRDVGLHGLRAVAVHTYGNLARSRLARGSTVSAAEVFVLRRILGL